jgi:hypothetical protein
VVKTCFWFYRGGIQLKPILKWQYEQIIKELLLLQEHQSDPSCPCESDGEMCVRKHLFAIEAYAEETFAMEDNDSYRQKLKNLAQEAKESRDLEEISLRGEHSDDLPPQNRSSRYVRMRV